MIASYGVVYLGGHPDYLARKAGKIQFDVLDNRFELSSTLGTRSWFKGLVIPYSNVIDLQIVQRQVTTFEGIIGGLDSRQLNQANNIHITYQDMNANEVLLRLEMLTGFTVMGQAGKCRELEDRLKTNHIRDHFLAQASQISSQQSSDEITSLIEKISYLRDKGILSQDEFEKKKAELLSRL